MSETVEMMMNGLICSQCGSWMEDFEEPGYPRVCEDCQKQQIKGHVASKMKKQKRNGAKKNGN